MSAFTPVKVRGKRKALASEKWHHGKKRRMARSASRAMSDRSSSAHTTASIARSSTQKKRKRPDAQLSRLEQLPTEILQSIFVFSANVELAVASPQLALQLANAHLQVEITGKVLNPVLEPGVEPTASQLKIVARLMNSRFFTWSFFKQWLHSRFKAHREAILAYMARQWISTDATGPDIQSWATWGALTVPPQPGLLPPPKLLTAPFTDDKVEFLGFMTRFKGGGWPARPPAYAEIVKTGLKQAVTTQVTSVLPLFWRLDWCPDIELLRYAVIEAGCNKAIVQMLLERVVDVSCGPNPPEFDFLDPTVWSWAEEARLRGDPKGIWLTGRLKTFARAAERGNELFSEP